jgi:hypothetical protein
MSDETKAALPDPAPPDTAPYWPDPPKYWMNETSGYLARAMRGFIAFPALEMPAEDLGLIRDYIIQWIDSPAWEANANSGAGWAEELAELRAAARRIANVRKLNAWLIRAVDCGLDPL